MKQFYAHSTDNPDKSDWQLLEGHLRGVASLAEDFAAVFGAGEWGRLVGIWHDLGKYSVDFQRRLDGENIRVVHSEAGGHLAKLKQWRGADMVLSWVIMGHHAGLADFSSSQSGAKALEPKMREPDRSADILKNVPEAILNQSLPAMPTMFSNQRLFPDLALFIRMLYSCLVDADFLDTEAFMDPNREKDRNREQPDMKMLSTAFDQYMSQFGNSSGVVNECRALVLEQCRSAAEKQGVFSLTVPTGGGKTLSSLAFALRHAVKYGKRRIIYVIPYTSIIEQTASVFRSIPGFEDAILEHHSNLVWDDGREDENRKKRLAMENWDAPVIVTTSVQFFESLYANRSSRCRKLHNIANSVVIFDEAQCLPPSFLRPCVFVIRELLRHYWVTPVLCTATQPVLDKRSSFDFVFKEGLEGVQEIIEQPEELSRRLERVSVERLNDLQPVSNAELAETLQKENRSLLCIVNRKADARKLAQMLPQDQMVHLSTNMCAAHRLEVLAEIRRRLLTGERTLVISTSLVEAGVDLDFPVVYRALAGLDSIAQAAGRCNREGKLDMGRTVVFVPEQQPAYVQSAASVAFDYLKPEKLKNIFLPETFRSYFHEYFFMKGTSELDSQGILELLPKRMEEICFQMAAEKFRLIDDDWQVALIVPFGEAPLLIDKLYAEPWHAKKLYRQLQRFSVNVSRQVFDQLLAEGYVSEVKGGEGVYCLHVSQLYDDRFGFTPPDMVECFGGENLVV